MKVTNEITPNQRFNPGPKGHTKNSDLVTSVKDPSALKPWDTDLPIPVTLAAF